MIKVASHCIYKMSFDLYKDFVHIVYNVDDSLDSVDHRSYKGISHPAQC